MAPANFRRIETAVREPLAYSEQTVSERECRAGAVRLDGIRGRHSSHLSSRTHIERTLRRVGGDRARASQAPTCRRSCSRAGSSGYGDTEVTTAGRFQRQQPKGGATTRRCGPTRCEAAAAFSDHSGGPSPRGAAPLAAVIEVQAAQTQRRNKTPSRQTATPYPARYGVLPAGVVVPQPSGPEMHTATPPELAPDSDLRRPRVPPDLGGLPR
jgi:hypothetical protein